MTRSERRLFRDTSIIGLCLTVIVVSLEMGNAFVAPERFFYDFRARHCQFTTPPPTDQLVHLNIDDPALDVIGRWPWPRSVLAELVDEVHAAGAKALALDVIFPEPSQIGHREIGTPRPTTIPIVESMDPVVIPPRPAATQPARPGKTPGGAANDPAGNDPDQIVLAVRVDHDDAFAKSLKRFGRVVVPVGLNLSQLPLDTVVYEPMVEVLARDPELYDQTDIDKTRAALVRLLREQGVEDDALVTAVNRYAAAAAEEGMFRRIERELNREELTPDQLRRLILPKIDATIGGSALISRLEKHYQRVISVRSLRRFARPADKSSGLLEAHDAQATIHTLAAAAALTGYVDYVPMADGVVRTVPLWAINRGYAFPQFGLAMACVMLGVDIQQVRVTPNALFLPCPDGRTIEVPVRSHDTPRGTYGAFFDIAWFGKSGLNEWRTMYDHRGNHTNTTQHVSLLKVWDVCLIRHKIAHNNRNAATAVRFLARGLRNTPLPPKLKALGEPDPTQPEAYEPVLKLIEAEMTEQLWLPYLNEITKEEYDALPDYDAEEKGLDKSQVDSYRALKSAVEHNRGLKGDLERQRAGLRRDLEGKACLVGYTAVGAIADFIPTSLHPRCPGAAVHGVIFNSIMTGDFWRTADDWAGVAFTLLLGIMTTASVATLQAWKALATTAALIVGYLLFNGLYLFDYKNLVVDVSSPLFAGMTVWAGGTLARYVLESAERRRVQAKFSSYADKVLVDYVINNPDVKLDGQNKELSVVFTDLQGFTTLSELLDTRTVPLLNEYMGLMVPIIRNHGGYLNKFLGDGIMYFFGAPLPDERHAHNAVASVLRMQAAMPAFNRSLAERGLPTLVLRGGITTGKMVVGDAGPPERADYTVIGDNVNLSARLEGANKAVGTQILINDRCRQLIGDAFFCRPIAKLKVKGKKQGVLTFEALAFAGSETDEQIKLARMTTEVVDPFWQREFARCLESIAVMEKVFGPGKFTKLYRGYAEQYLVEPPPEDWAGEIELTEK